MAKYVIKAEFVSKKDGKRYGTPGDKTLSGRGGLYETDDDVSSLVAAGCLVLADKGYTPPFQGSESDNTNDDANNAGAANSGQGGNNEGPAINASKKAVELAEQNKIDLATLTGTGQNGQITAKDVQDAIAAKNA